MGATLAEMFTSMSLKAPKKLSPLQETDVIRFQPFDMSTSCLATSVVSRGGLCSQVDERFALNCFLSGSQFFPKREAWTQDVSSKRSLVCTVAPTSPLKTSMKSSTRLILVLSMKTFPF